jgi:hypothetical protein
MKSITRLSLALIMFSLFSVSYFVTSAIGEDGYAGHNTPVDISHCANLEATAARPACEAAAHSMDSPAATFDDSLMRASGMSRAAITVSDSVVCGGFNNKVMAEINCLRVHLDTTAFRSNRRSSNGIGNYGCGNREDRHQQVHCLRNILDGNGLAPGTQP